MSTKTIRRLIIVGGRRWIEFQRWLQLRGASFSAFARQAIAEKAEREGFPFADELTLEQE